MAVFWKAAKHKIQKATLTWGQGSHDLHGVVLHGMAVFLKNRDSEKIQPDRPMAADKCKRKNDDGTVSKKASGSVWAGVCM